MKKFFSLAFFFALLVCPVAFGQSSPIPVLENAANQVIDDLKSHRPHLKNNPKIVQQAVRKYLLPIVDVRGMARSVLGRQAWNQASTSQKKQFTQAFTNLVIRTYANPLAEYSDEKVKFYPIRGGVNGRFVQVNSVITRSSGQNIPLSYSLVSKKGQWKIYDLSVEGVSLLQSFRSQFGQVLQNSSMDELIRQMNRQKTA